MKEKCLEWQYSKTNGYGRWTKLINGKRKLAHRVLWEKENGKIPEGLELDHLCRNRSCVNLDHLEPVTRLENQRRSPISITTVNSKKSHCPRGHEYSQENTYRLSKNRRSCLICRRMWARYYYHTKQGNLNKFKGVKYEFTDKRI